MDNRVLIVGSARKSAGGVSSVVKLMEKMPLWKTSLNTSSRGTFGYFWLGSQIQRNHLWKLWYAVKANVIAFFIMWRYDFVHMHTTPDKLGLLIQLPILLLANIWRKKVILHLHVGNQLKTKKNSLFVYCLKKADLIILLAKKWERLFSDYYPEVSTPTTVLYNACEYVPEVKRSEKEKIIMMAAWFNDNKAPDLLLKSLTLTLSSKDEKKDANGQYRSDALDGWKVMMLGNGEVERFQKMAHDMGLDNIVTFTGYVTGQTREDYFKKASIYCMCSYEEGFPMVVLESWMYGINVITTPVGGLPDVLEDGKNALTFDFGNWEQLASQLQILMSDADKRQQMAEYSRKFVEDKFSMDKISNDLENIYASLC